MASGKLGGANLSANTETLLYQPGSGILASFTVSFSNRNANMALIRIALSASGDSGGTDDDWVTYDVVLPGKGTYERTGLVLGSQGKCFVTSNTANVTAVAYGYEEIE